MTKSEDAAIRKLAERVHSALDDGKAVDIRTLDVRKLTVITDYMIVASGRSSRQVKALTDRVLECARDQNVKPLGLEGQGAGEWVLVDLGGVVIHIMQPAARDFYQLEKLWEDRPQAQVDAR